VFVFAGVVILNFALRSTVWKALKQCRSNIYRKLLVKHFNIFINVDIMFSEGLVVAEEDENASSY
jgi:hypothetical protein